MKKVRGTTWYPQPHDLKYMHTQTLESATHKNAIDIPLICYDEGKGAPSSNFTNAKNVGAFGETNNPHCYPDSSIGQFKCGITFQFGRLASNSNLPSYKYGVQVIAMAFVEDYTAKDEVTGLEIEDIMEMQHETTNRVGYPLFNGTDVQIPFTGSTTLGNLQDGLTTDTKNESIDFDLEMFYDMLHYSPLAGKLKSVQSGIRWFTLSKYVNHTRKHNIFLKSKVKYMNEYAYLGVRIILPLVGTFYQTLTASDTTVEQAHMSWNLHCRYHEWNENFNFERQ